MCGCSAKCTRLSPICHGHITTCRISFHHDTLIFLFFNPRRILSSLQCTCWDNGNFIVLARVSPFPRPILHCLSSPLKRPQTCPDSLPFTHSLQCYESEFPRSHGPCAQIGLHSNARFRILIHSFAVLGETTEPLRAEGVCGAWCVMCVWCVWYNVWCVVGMWCHVNDSQGKGKKKEKPKPSELTSPFLPTSLLIFSQLDLSSIRDPLSDTRQINGKDHVIEFMDHVWIHLVISVSIWGVYVSVWMYVDIMFELMYVIVQSILKWLNNDPIHFKIVSLTKFEKLKWSSIMRYDPISLLTDVVIVSKLWPTHLALSYPRVVVSHFSMLAKHAGSRIILREERDYRDDFVGVTIGPVTCPTSMCPAIRYVVSDFFSFVFTVNYLQI